MLPESPSAARVCEYVCDLEYLFSRMNVGSYGATEPHVWLMSKIPSRTWDDCRTTSERKFEVCGLILQVLDAFRPRGATWSR